MIDHLQDAMRNESPPRRGIEGDWETAVRAAVDAAHVQPFGGIRERTFAREFNVARSALALRNAGFAIRLEPGKLSLEESAETKLVASIENIIIGSGGLNVARRIFAAIKSLYDPEQQRYHVIRRTSMIGGGQPQVPWGYLIQLAVKHLRSGSTNNNTDERWQALCGLATAYTAVGDVQPYAPAIYGARDEGSLLPYLQEVAVYDTLFRIPQMRPSDVVKMARGVLGWLDTGVPTKSGWSIDHALEIICYLLDPKRDLRGPTFIDEADVRRACPGVPRPIVAQILDQVLSHPPTGANQKFSRPTDAPIIEDPTLRDAGYDFFMRPLLHLSGRRFVLLDRSVCAPACIEALFGQLRKEIDQFEDKVGLATERFLQSEFASHGVPSATGKYEVAGERGECDLVIEAPATVIFAEVKKKPLTRRAKAGSGAHLLIDLAGSLLAAQAQTGWHELRLRRLGYLDLIKDGTTKRIELRGRGIERIAVSLLDFGGFQDRVLLKQFLEATLSLGFGSPDPKIHLKLSEINDALAEIRKQVAELHAGEEALRQPFFHCWFVSVPQILVLLDDVTDEAGFKSALWAIRHVVTDSADVYFDLAIMRKWRRESSLRHDPPSGTT